MEWNSSQYLLFENQRTQPAVDLARRVEKYQPKTIIDIGCGPGNSTNVLRQTFPNANIVGIDGSCNMIKQAKSEYPNLNFHLCRVEDLSGTYDLLFSNACLQWVPNHQELIPTLMGKLNEHGVLAVQVPMNAKEPLYRIITETIKQPQWGFQDTVFQVNQVLTSNEYFNILSKCSSSFEIWETKYYHSLPNHQALVEWVKGTKLRPYLAKLNRQDGMAFEREIVKKTKHVYPVMDNGKIVLGFRRLFFIAVK